MGMLALDFMVRALIAGALTGVMAPAVGTYIVQRRLSLLGDGLGHVAIAGVGLALLTGRAPVTVAVVITVIGAVAIEWLRQTGRASGDVGLAILFYGGLASGVLMAGLAGQGAGTLSQYLFGSLTSINNVDLVVVAAMAVVVLITAIGLSPQLFAVCADEDYARAQGLPTRALNLIIVVMAAITVAISMRTVGLLLVSALMVVPVATSQNLVLGFRRGLATAMGLGLALAVGGVVASYYLDTASGATIVVLAVLVFGATLPVNSLLERRQRASRPETDDEPLFERAEPHEDLSDAQRHPAVLHGDHVDYLHDGHRHAPHGDHFDEH
ncbi:MAG: metal ABC transporter permease [Acidobacteriota bacterium]|nr:metal ABC transporter permease [Acidobacteriota bacterium]NLH70948.1 metal ABC transporter permease [Brooklawnia sp.]